MKNVGYIAIKNEDGLLDKLIIHLGYEWYINQSYDEIIGDCKDDKYLFIIIVKDDDDFGNLVDGGFNDETDVEINIDDIPLRKDLNDFVSILKEGSKLGLL